jgi:hypothetical protein
VALKNDLISLLSQQAVLVLSTHTEALRRIEARLATNHKFYATVSDGTEDSASAFVSSHGGEEAVRMVSAEFECLLGSAHVIRLDLERPSFGATGLNSRRETHPKHLKGRQGRRRRVLQAELVSYESSSWGRPTFGSSLP